MNCKRLVELITDYLEGAMPEAERGLVDEHLAGCAGCSTYLEQCRATVRLTGMLTEAQITPAAREVLGGVFRDWQTTG
jgi:anti-sigma factor RsiW